MAQKPSILEQALLQVQTLEEAVKANAKGILASTMKEELNSLLKEQEDEKDPEEEEKDVPETPGDEDPSISDEEPTADTEDVPAVDDELGEPEAEPEMEPDMEPDNDADDVLDMTGASEAEVMKVFKAMKPEDGIVVKKEGDNVQFSDGENEYIIKLDGEETPEETPELPSEDEGNEFPEGLSEQNEPAESDEIVYEIELDDEDGENEVETKEGMNAPFDKKVSGKRVEAKEGVTVTKSVTTKDGQPFTKSSPQKGVTKLETDVTKPHKVEAKEQETGVDKWSGTAPKGTNKPKTTEPGKGQPKTSDGRPGTGVKGTDKPVVKEPKEEECKECGKEMEATEAARTKWNPHGNKPEDGPKRAGLPSKKVFKAGSTVGNVNEEVEILRKQNGEYKKALVLFKDKLNEVAVFNANLAYATRLFTEHSTTKQEKLEILKRFDSVSVITESKNLYNTIKGELEKTKPITEKVVEKIAATPTSSSTEVLSEAKAYENPQFKRMKDLMQKIK